MGDIMSLTERERQVLCMLCLPNKEIAKRLGVSEGTVKRHLESIFNQFPLSITRAQLLFNAVDKGIIELKDIVRG